MFPWKIMTNPARLGGLKNLSAVRERPMTCDCWTPSLPMAAPGIALALEVMGPASALSSAGVRFSWLRRGAGAGAVN